MPGSKAKYSIEYHPKVAEDDIPKLDEKIKNIIERKIIKLIEEPHFGTALRGRLIGCYRLKISKYRIVYKVYDEKLIIFVIAIGKRDNLFVYKTAEKRI